MYSLPCCVAGVFLLLHGCAHEGQATEPKAGAGAVLRLTRTIELRGVGGPVDSLGFPGRIDHMAYDPGTHRLFVACIANGSLEVIDLDRGERVKSVGGLKRPQGVVVVKPAGLVIVSTGGDGKVHAFDTRTLAAKGTAAAGEDADNVRLAPDGTVHVGFGGNEGPGGLAGFDPKTLARTGTVALPLRPESFQFDPSGSTVFVNQPGTKTATTDGSVIAVEVGSGKVRWRTRLRHTARNFGMALDAHRHRLFVSSRLPARLMVLDARTGAVHGECACAPDSDDVFVDADSGRVLVVGGGNRADNKGAEGGDGAGAAVEVFDVGPQGRMTEVGAVLLPPHARTGLFVPERRAIYVAVPPHDGHPAEVREYQLGKAAPGPKSAGPRQGEGHP